MALFRRTTMVQAIPKDINPLLSSFTIQTKFIDLSRKQLDDETVPLEEIAKYFPTIERLDLFVNRLAKIPPVIGKLIHLQKLDLYSNRITSIPPEIGQLIQLRELFLYYNKLKELPEEIGK